jgi:hypothetical protein
MSEKDRIKKDLGQSESDTGVVRAKKESKEEEEEAAAKQEQQNITAKSEKQNFPVIETETAIIAFGGAVKLEKKSNRLKFQSRRIMKEYLLDYIKSEQTRIRALGLGGNRNWMRTKLQLFEQAAQMLPLDKGKFTEMGIHDYGFASEKAQELWEEFHGNFEQRFKQWFISEHLMKNGAGGAGGEDEQQEEVTL